MQVTVWMDELRFCKDFRLPETFAKLLVLQGMVEITEICPRPAGGKGLGEGWLIQPKETLIHALKPPSQPSPAKGGGRGKLLIDQALYSKSIFAKVPT